MNETQDITATMALAEQLWTHANWTPALKELWIDALKGLRQDLLAQAMRDVRSEYTSRDPELKWVRARYGALYEQKFPNIRTRENGTRTWHVSWQRTSKHGVPNAWYGTRADTQEHAERIARENGGKVTCMDPDADTVTEHEVREAHRAALAALSDMPRAQVEGLLERLRSIGFCKGKLPARLRDWPRMSVLAVHAEFQLQRKREAKS